MEAWSELGIKGCAGKWKKRKGEKQSYTGLIFSPICIKDKFLPQKLGIVEFHFISYFHSIFS